MLEEDYLVNQIDQTWSIQCPEDSSIEVNEKGRSPLWNLICIPKTKDNDCHRQTIVWSNALNVTRRVLPLEIVNYQFNYLSMTLHNARSAMYCITI